MRKYDPNYDPRSTIPLFNPLNEDFSSVSDGVAYTLPAKEVTYVRNLLVPHALKHLSDRIYQLRGDTKKDYEVQMKTIKEQITTI